MQLCPATAPVNALFAESEEDGRRTRDSSKSTLHTARNNRNQVEQPLVKPSCLLDGKQAPLLESLTWVIENGKLGWH